MYPLFTLLHVTFTTKTCSVDTLLYISLYSINADLIHFFIGYSYPNLYFKCGINLSIHYIIRKTSTAVGLPVECHNERQLDEFLRYSFKRPLVSSLAEK